MIDQYVRSVLPNLVKPILTLYARYQVHPNLITVVGFILACAAAVAVGCNWPYLALSLWWLSRLFDGTDGIWARESMQASPLGAYLDILLDMMAYSLMIIGFAFLHPGLSYHWMMILVLYVACITSALVMGSQQGDLRHSSPQGDNRGIRLAIGLAEGGETGLAYTAFLLMPEYIESLVLVWTAVLIATVLARTVLIKKLQKASNK